MIQKRMSAEERKLAIVQAVIPLFASKGFRGVTTRELAQAADVSEALLYRHFPSKESLYTEIQSSICKGVDAKANHLADLEPGTATLVMIVFLLVRGPVEGFPGDGFDHSVLKRMLTNSLMEDGEFARSFLSKRVARWMPTIVECLEAAAKSGEAKPEGVTPSNAIWLSHHLAVGISLIFMPGKPVVDYETDKDTLIKEAVFFALRGMGVDPKAIHRHYQPEAYMMFLGG